MIRAITGSDRARDDDEHHRRRTSVASSSAVPRRTVTGHKSGRSHQSKTADRLIVVIVHIPLLSAVFKRFLIVDLIIREFCDRSK